MRIMAEIYKIGASLDSTNSPKEQEQILKVLESGNSVIIDMSDTTYVSSAGLRVLLYSYKVAMSKDLKVYLVGVCDDVKDVMDLTGFIEHFDIYETMEECKAAIG